MWIFADDDAQVLINFVVDGVFVVPTAAWATVRDNTGSVLIASEALTIDGTTATLTVPGANNSLASGADTSNRYVNVYFNSNGRQYRQDLNYRVMSFLPITTGYDDVRAVLGLENSELPDTEIDIPQAYLELKREYGDLFTEALTAETVLNGIANRAIAIKAAIEVSYSLELRTGIKFSSEEQTFQRMSEINFTAMRLGLGKLLATQINILLDQEDVGTASFVVATPTDAITGG